jgi:hypothetical protein
MTSLHYAASRGHQNALLLLLHAGACIDSTNNSLDTPLHLAAQNGHEGCVKALIYYAEHSRQLIDLSGRNSKGDTALHFASRWGFQGIVQILTEHGAAITVTNSRYTSPIDCAHNVHILKILQRSLQRRTLVQQSHGDFVNIEMIQKEDCGGMVMLISEPEEKKVLSPSKEELESQKSKSAATSRNISRIPSRNPSRRSSSTTAPIPSLLVVPGTGSASAPRSRRVSTNRNPNYDANSSINEETEQRLLSVAEQLKQDPASPNFVFDYFEDYDPTEQDHIMKITVENLETSTSTSNLSSFAGMDSIDSKGKDINTII